MKIWILAGVCALSAHLNTFAQSELPKLVTELPSLPTQQPMSLSTEGKKYLPLGSHGEREPLQINKKVDEKKLGDINQSLLTSNSVLNAPSIVNPVTNPEPGSTMSNIRAKIMARLASLSSTPNRAIIEINNTNGVIGGNVTASVTDNRADGRQDNRIINKNGAGVYGSIDPATGMPLAAPLPSAATQSGQPVASAAEIAKAQGDAQVAAAKQISDNAKKQAAKEDGLTLLGTGIGSAFGLPFIGGAIGKFLGKIF